jgi:hypothetical protein
MVGMNDKHLSPLQNSFFPRFEKLLEALAIVHSCSPSNNLAIVEHPNEVFHRGVGQLLPELSRSFSSFAISWLSKKNY